MIFIWRSKHTSPSRAGLCLTSLDPATVWLGAQVGWGQGPYCPALAGLSERLDGLDRLQRWHQVGDSG